MEIFEIINIQKECRQKARAMTRHNYRKYDAIWDTGIRITPELEALGVIGEINGKMPNLFRRNDASRPTVGELARRYEFESSSDLVAYLLAYEPRGKYEDRLYLTLLERALPVCTVREYEVATTMTTGEIKAVVRDCNALAREITQNAYEKYDEIWAGKIRITPELQKHGKEAIAEINRKMPNLLTHDPSRSALDQVAMQYDFECSQDLVDYLLAYEPRTAYQESVCDELTRQALGLTGGCLPATADALDIDQVPF